jgi:hypothetical protein
MERTNPTQYGRGQRLSQGDRGSSYGLTPEEMAEKAEYDRILEESYKFGAFAFVFQTGNNSAATQVRDPFREPVTRRGPVSVLLSANFLVGDGVPNYIQFSQIDENTPVNPIGKETVHEFLFSDEA